ncbi:hypothetical protein O181_101844 [Austropuccinia psidii MF-1]|uniref:Uncharacterized protein n=1 Tax=Austropuccinia psidii MF-1 TaxID=1389203 RepID=A0A9Q3PHQ0_9BASI|nr:hypothetical protein [Austropuccinia psidii MF-1]
MIQTMEDIIRRFCAYGMEYKEHERFIHDWVTLLPEVQMAYNTSQSPPHREITVTGRKRVEPPIACGSPEEKSSNYHPTAKDFDDMWKTACDTASRCIPEAKEYSKQRWDKSHMEPDFKEGTRKKAVEVKLTEKFSRKHPVFPVSLVKPYIQTEEDRLPCRKKNPTPPEMVKVEDSPGPVKKIIKARKIRLNGKDQRKYLVRFEHQTADPDKWLEEDAIPERNLHLRIFRANRRT